MIGSQPRPAQVQIAAAGSAELDAVMKVMNSAFDPGFGEAWTRSQCAGILPMSGVAMIIAREESANEPLGFALFRTIAGESELLLLAVAPQSRRRGVGRRLLDRFVERARADGAERAHLEVRDGNPAVQMYLAAGFSPAGRRRNYYRGSDGSQFDAITLARSI
jgi:ribosomal-protein-alanine N-acetyltransferase